MSFSKASSIEMSSLPNTVTSSPPKFGETKWLNKRKRPVDGVTEFPEEKATPLVKEEIAKDEIPQPSSKKRKVEDRELWKLMKGKYMLTFYLCPDDWQKLYNRKDKVMRQANGLFSTNFEMCEDCAWANCRSADYIAPPKNKQKNGGQ
uniref:Tnp_DDE_dom domain-containing protein n=1 Tax=Globodera pallida TaxID=36090 RepID=A0A183C3K1_GLOPA